MSMKKGLLQIYGRDQLLPTKDELSELARLGDAPRRRDRSSFCVGRELELHRKSELARIRKQEAKETTIALHGLIADLEEMGRRIDKIETVEWWKSVHNQKVKIVR